MAKHSVKRAIEYQTKGERNGIIGAVVVGLIFLAFIGSMGSVSRLSQPFLGISSVSINTVISPFIKFCTLYLVSAMFPGSK